eukprot:CAMPEP_0194348896 /NCGR_PEP_ID=MMETSP0171-20130528/106788_1 /TAXON_ID=218684 /ORGANISM="Corethron pennatum, Strain L29A3" /LENGTH=78 /DNA_ID=CAMNT_0039116287 /DNA_START=715 /DNA_END=954 /DNA_ORIENTATION=-
MTFATTSFLRVTELMGTSPSSFISTEADFMASIASLGIFACLDESSGILERIKKGVSSSMEQPERQLGVLTLSSVSFI